jgi:RNA polymerase sigma factor FliA
MNEIGLILGVVESRVSQIHASAVLHLRARLSASPPTQIREKTETNRNRSVRGKQDLD